MQKYIITLFYILAIVMIIVTYTYKDIIDGEIVEPKSEVVIAEINQITEEEALKEKPIIYDIPLDKKYQKLTWKLCQEYQLSYELILAIMEQESSFRPDVTCFNGDSHGLMQLHDSTYSWLGEEVNIKNFNVFNPKHNIKAGVWYVDYLRNYWRELGLPEEEVIYLTLISYNRGIAGCTNYVEQHGLNNNYVNEVLEKKYFYESNIL